MNKKDLNVLTKKSRMEIDAFETQLDTEDYKDTEVTAFNLYPLVKVGRRLEVRVKHE